MSTCITIKSANERCHTVLLLDDRGGSTFKLGRPGPAMACICVLVFFCICIVLYCICLTWPIKREGWNFNLGGASSGGRPRCGGLRRQIVGETIIHHQRHLCNCTTITATQPSVQLHNLLCSCTTSTWPLWNVTPKLGAKPKPKIYSTSNQPSW